MGYERKNPISKEHKEILAAIGRRIHEMRISTGLSIERFCSRNQIPRISYSNLEAGRNFHMTTLLKVLSVYPEVKSLNQFFNGL